MQHKPNSIFEAAYEVLAEAKEYVVQIEYGPHMSEMLNVKAKDEEDAKKKALALFLKNNPAYRNRNAYASSVDLIESASDILRETEDKRQKSTVL
jgi:hypothetical protein